jgi:protein involved in polysaccharide export with SLBB domain
MIPENPKSVSVFGQVYSPVSLAYQPGKTVSYYLSKVGGATENANTSEMFIVRADGTVYSRQQGGMGVRWDGDGRRWVAGGFNATEIYPGDALLVPEKIKKLDVMREVKDISTIIYQMALGAAAVASF